MSDLIIIGVDHGYAAMKTAHFSFPTGLVEYEHEPYTQKDVLEYGGKYYVVGSARQPLQRDKTRTEDYYLLTLAAIAKELDSRSMERTAEVLLAAGLNLPDNVCGIVADCGYTSPREITRKCLPEYLPGMPLELTYAVGRLGAILFGHFDPEDADCEAAAAQSKVPILFVHGDADGFVPYDMGKRNYEACRAKGKKFLTVHGAEHAVSYYHDNEAYTKQATEFLQDCLARRGFVWPPETDEPEK